MKKSSNEKYFKPGKSTVDRCPLFNRPLIWAGGGTSPSQALKDPATTILQVEPFSAVHYFSIQSFLKRSIILLVITIITASSQAGFKAGIGKADITPPLGGRMYGYGARGTNVSDGIHDRLYAKAIVLSDETTALAIVTLDLGSIPAENTANVRRHVDAASGIDHILLIASHSHSTPTLTPDFPTPENSYVNELERKIARAIAQASRNMQPAQIGVGWGHVEEGHNRRKILPDGTVQMLWVNRDRLPTSPVDYALGVITIDKPNGEPIATLVNFNCHPVVLGPENLRISADYPGAMMAFVEEKLGGQCMFIQGAAGDINPFWDKTPPDEGGFEQMKKMGETIGREILRVRKNIDDLKSSERISVEQQIIPLKARWDLDDPEVQAAMRQRYGESVFRRYKDRYQSERQAEVNTVLIGSDLAIATFPGEFFVEHGIRLKESSVIKNTIFAGYCNGALGYFPTIRAATEGGYGAKQATIVEVGAGELLVNKALIRLHHQAGKLSKIP